MKQRVKILATVSFITALMAFWLFNTTELRPVHVQTQGQREPTSVITLIEGSAAILQDVRDPKIFNEATCESAILNVTDYLFHLSSDKFIPKSASEMSLMRRQGPSVIDNIFNIRLALKKRISQMTLKKRLDDRCINKIREAMQYARFTEEYVMEWLYSQGVYSGAAKKVLDGGRPYTWSKHSKVELKSGDVLLIRGKSHVSAMIARIADEEGNFSHTAIVGQDSKGNKFVVEALIETGVIMTPLKKWQEEQLARVSLYRFYDSAIAAKAGLYAYNLGAKSSQSNIRYDFGMNEKDYSTMFCSEVVRYSYDAATGGGIKLPYYMSTLNKFRGKPFPANMGIVQSKIYAPFDVDVDPHFEMIAEYRYRPYLQTVRGHDAVLQSMYEWISDKNYRFEPTLIHSVKALLGKTLRQFGFMRESLPSYMPVKAINVVLQFETAFGVLHENLKKHEAAYYRQYGHMMTFKDMMSVNEKFRLQDCLDEIKGRGEAGLSSKMHWFFSPSRGESCAR